MSFTKSIAQEETELAVSFYWVLNGGSPLHSVCRLSRSTDCQGGKIGKSGQLTSSFLLPPPASTCLRKSPLDGVAQTSRLQSHSSGSFYGEGKASAGSDTQPGRGRAGLQAAGAVLRFPLAGPSLQRPMQCLYFSNLAPQDSCQRDPQVSEDRGKPVSFPEVP